MTKIIVPDRASWVALTTVAKVSGIPTTVWRKAVRKSTVRSTQPAGPGGAVFLHRDDVEEMLGERLETEQR